jgi:hypothetical protein
MHVRAHKVVENTVNLQSNEDSEPPEDTMHLDGVRKMRLPVPTGPPCTSSLTRTRSMLLVEGVTEQKLSRRNNQPHNVLQLFRQLQFSLFRDNVDQNA